MALTGVAPPLNCINAKIFFIMAQPSLYKQNRGANGQFGSGFSQNSVQGKYSHLNPLYYYIYPNTYETRKVTGANGTIEPGGRRAKSRGETAIKNKIKTSGLQSAKVKADVLKKTGLR